MIPHAALRVLLGLCQFRPAFGTTTAYPARVQADDYTDFVGRVSDSVTRRCRFSYLLMSGYAALTRPTV